MRGSWVDLMGVGTKQSSHCLLMPTRDHPVVEQQVDRMIHPGEASHPLSLATPVSCLGYQNVPMNWVDVVAETKSVCSSSYCC